MHKTPEITRLIHENFWTVMAFAFGRPVISRVIDDRFEGHWKYLDRTANEMGEIKADRALLAMATQLRVLDDAEGIDDTYKAAGGRALGEVCQADNAKSQMYLRDMTNKVMHAASFEWDLSVPNEPKIICISNDPSRWKNARIEIVALMGMVGMLAY